MKPADLTGYKAIYPEFVDIEHTSKKWQFYSFNGVSSSAVCVLDNGHIFRLCEIAWEEGVEWVDDMTPNALAYLEQSTNGPIQSFMSMRDMIVHDLKQDEKFSGDPAGTPTGGEYSEAWSYFLQHHEELAEDMIEALRLGSELMSITWPEIINLMIRYGHPGG